MAAIKLKARILPSFVIASLLLFAFLLVVIYQEERGHIKDEFQRGGDALQAVYQAQLNSHAEKMQAALRFLEQDSDLRRAFAAGDRQQLQAYAAPIFERLREELNITHFYVLDPQRVCFLRVHQPQRYGDLIDRYTALEAERSGQLAYGAELGPLGTFTLRVVIPWYADGQLLGYLELGEEVETLYSEVASAFGVELLLLIDKHHVKQSDWEAGMRMLGRDADWSRLEHAVIPFHTSERVPTDLGAEQPLPLPAFNGATQTLWRMSLPVQDAGQREVGRLILLRDVSQRSHDLFDTTVLIGVVAAVVGMLLFTSYYLVLDRAEWQLESWEEQLRREAYERERLQEAHIRDLEHAVLYDALTELPNRKLLQERITQAIGADGTEHGTFAVLSLELHRLREINDTLGHEIGDLLLQKIAVRLSQAVCDNDVLARPGGGEFMLLLHGRDQETAARDAQRLLALLGEPFTIQGLTLDIGATIGIALYPLHGGDAAILLRRVDVAQRYAKRAHEAYAVYETERDPHNLRWLKLFGELRKAINSGGLQLHYQPQLDLMSDRVERVEALARWQHPELGVVSPDEFVTLAEDTGLIRPFTTWVLDQALYQCHQWREAGLSLQVAVNLSAHNLLDSALPELIAKLLQRWQLDSRSLSLEITESAFMYEPVRVMEVVRRLHAMGLALAIDDFGTGYSSLAYLKRLPISELKIDRSFVAEMLQDDSDAMIVKSTIDLAHDLGLTVVAEGVETLEVQQALKVSGCDAIQGYYLSRPLPAAALVEWLRTRGG